MMFHFPQNQRCLTDCVQIWLGDYVRDPYSIPFMGFVDVAPFWG